MGIAKAIRSDFSAKISLKLAGAVLVLTVAAAAVITPHQTRQLEELTLDKATTAAKLGARYYGEALDHAIDAGLITVADAFDRNYLPIKGFDFGQRPRFHTRFDSVTDGAVLVFQDQFLLDPDFTFAIGTDDHGYIPTHDTVFSQALIGNAEKDNLNNNKTRGEYAEAVRAAESLSAVLVQDYLRRRTGERMWDVSSPIYVKGRHWGAFRVGVSKVRVKAHERDLLWLLAAIFAVFFGVTIGSIYLVVRNAMKPVVALTLVAEQVSLGEALESPIRPTTTDEVGQLSKAIDRLRVSMKAAMSRLGH